jgi:uncharacterized membrane protein YfcA
VSDVLWLLAAGVLAGVVSVVASLASLVSYPALLAVGLPPLSANVTNTVSLVFTGLGAAAGSRQELAGQGRRTLGLALLNAGGGATGAVLLLVSPAGAFQAVVPWLVAGASLVLLAGRRLPRLLGVSAHEGGVGLRVAVFAVAVYTGYFGAAGGVLMLAVLTALLEQPLARTIAVKNVVSGVANGVASVGFVLFGPVVWSAALPLGAGFLLGGWLGPAVVRRVPGERLRVAVALCGLGVAVELALDAYR